MLKRHQLKALVNERLEAAAEEIFRIFETTIRDYEAIVLRSKQEVDQQQSRLAGGKALCSSLSEKKTSSPPSEQCPFDKKTDLCEDDQEPPRIEGEQRELWRAQAVHNQQEEADTKDSISFICKRPDDNAQQFPHDNPEAAENAEPTSSHAQLKSEPDKEVRDASEPTRDCQMSEVSDDAGRVCGGFDSGGNRKKPWRGGDETADRPHTCSICNKNFRIKSILTRHMKTHTGEKPYSCGVCDKSFIQRSYLHTHMNSHSGKKPHTCSFCGRGFTQVGNMNAHIRIHTGEKPHSCADCGKSFREKADLIKHTIIHTGEKPYVCTVCRMRFSAQSNLTRHTKTHSGERPYSCSSCGKKFIRRSHLLIHMKTHAVERL
uniref:zinc finger protein 835-like n=1 Tax=Gasterosteus aculeatus aculeatus TaxID=481459 RepID=UPI001A99A919|nr:zinc finger protein 835-like [Gasterosteus aculeatus aculeatus]